MGHKTHTTVESPVGVLTLVATEGALSGLFMTDQRHRPPLAHLGEPARGIDASTTFSEVIHQLEEYFAGRRRTFDLTLASNGTSFQRLVWAALMQIPYGQTASYGQIAERIGNHGASRAVGMANGANPIGIIVPCHRVVGANGGLTGYGGGLERKRFLLDLERRRCATGNPEIPSVIPDSAGETEGRAALGSGNARCDR